MKQYARGFTIVELLIVIVVIAILASISVVSYRGVQGRAHDASIYSDLKNFSDLIEIAKSDNGGAYPTTVGALNNLGVKRSSGSYASSNYSLQYCSYGTNFVIAGESKSGSTYYFSSSAGTILKRTNNPRSSDWCQNDFGMSSAVYAAWTTPTADWNTTNSSTGN